MNIYEDEQVSGKTSEEYNDINQRKSSINLLDRLKGLGAGVLIFIIIGLIASVFALIFFGSIVIGQKIFGWLVILSIIAMALSIFILTPLSLFKSLRLFTGKGFIITSYILGITLWFLGLLTSWAYSATWVLVLALFHFGLGVIPVGFFACLFNGKWYELLSFIVLLILIITFHTIGEKIQENYN